MFPIPHSNRDGDRGQVSKTFFSINCMKCQGLHKNDVWNPNPPG